MAKAKKNSTKNKKSKSKLSELKNLLRKHKLLAVLIVILLLVIVTFTYGKFKNWENAQFMRGLATDFPQLVEEIETATGLELEIITDCSITTEKFSSGVRTCELIVSAGIADEDTINNYKKVLDSSAFNKDEPYPNGKGYDYKYKNKNSCGFGIYARGGDLVSFSCITAVREANIELARELFLDNKQ